MIAGFFSGGPGEQTVLFQFVKVDAIQANDQSVVSVVPIFKDISHNLTLRFNARLPC